MFLEARIDDLDSGAHYVDATALFINMRPQSEEKGSAEEATPDQSMKPFGDVDAGPTDRKQWHMEPVHT